MPKRKTAADWRAFLRGLGRSGNARLAAREAGMDVATAYDRRIRDDAFAARWEVELARGQARAAKAKGPLHRRSGGPPPRSGEELVARKTKHGTQLIRAAPGRWNAKAEQAFRAALRLTGCVTSAARACGFSTTALYKRRENYPDFAAAWAADEAAARERLPGLLSAAAIAALDPELHAEGLPRIDVDQAIRIVQLHGPKGIGSKPAPELPVEEARAEILRRIEAIRRHGEKSERPLHRPPAGPESGRSLSQSDLGLPGAAQPDSPRPGEDL